MTDAHFTLDIHPAAVRATARRIKRVLQTLEPLPAGISRTPDEIGDQWTGSPATRVKTEMTALGDRLTKTGPLLHAAHSALTTLAQQYDAALDRLPALNRRWDNAMSAHTDSVRSIHAARAREDSDDTATFRDQLIRAGDTLRSTQASLTRQFDDLRVELRRDTRTAAAALHDAMALQTTRTSLIDQADLSLQGPVRWHEQAQAELGLNLVTAHYQAQDLQRTAAATANTFLDYAEVLELYLERMEQLRAEADPSELVGLLDELLADTQAAWERVSAENRGMDGPSWALQLSDVAGGLGGALLEAHVTALRQTAQYTADLASGYVNRLSSTTRVLDALEFYDEIDHWRSTAAGAADDLARTQRLANVGRYAPMALGGVLTIGGIFYDIHGPNQESVGQAVTSNLGGFAASVGTGALIGTAIGGPVGTVVGTVVGAGVGIFTSGMIDELWESGGDVGDALLAGTDAVLDAGEAIADVGGAIVDGIGSLFD